MRPDDGDLDLSAVRYICGEMAAAEADSFEARLAVDQAARESVEYAVRIAAASVRVMPVSVPSRLLAPIFTWRRAVAAAVAIFSLGLGLHFVSSAVQVRTGAPVTPAEVEARRLIASWVDFGDPETTSEGARSADPDAGSVFGVGDEGEEGEEDGVGDESGGAIRESGAEIAGFEADMAPDWMIQGLSK